jgi:uncharacterized SAM-binding protein YcdF (DUF218 family)
MFVVAAVAIWLRPQSAALRRAVLVAAIVYGLCSVYLVPAAASQLLVRGYHKFEARDVSSGTPAIVVLGAGDETIFGWEDERLFLPYSSAAARVLEARRIFRLINAPWIISSGGKSDPGNPSEPASTNMRTLLVQIGVPADRIVLESESRNTHDEAVAIAAMLPSLHADRVVIVTSAVHMRRSLATFRAAGIAAIPAIVQHQHYGMRWSEWLIPSYSGLSFSSDLLHELVGIPYYWIRGWYR